MKHIACISIVIFKYTVFENKKIKKKYIIEFRKYTKKNLAAVLFEALVCEKVLINFKSEIPIQFSLEVCIEHFCIIEH